MSEECISSCFHSLNNKKYEFLIKNQIWLVYELANLPLRDRLLRYCHKFGQHLQKSQKIDYSIYILFSKDLTASNLREL